MPVRESPPKPEPSLLHVAKTGRDLLNETGKPETCENITRESMGVFLKLRKSGMEGAGALNTYLDHNQIPVEPPKGTVFTLNIIFHVFVLYAALTMLYKTVIAPLEAKTLQSELEDKLTEGIDHAFEKLTPEQSANVEAALRVSMPVLQKVRDLNNVADIEREAGNRRVFDTAYGIIGMLFLTFVIVVAILAASKVRIWKHVMHILFENLIIFAIIGGAEYTFFTLIAKKFVPVMPSQLGRNALDAAVDAFQ